VTLSPDEVERLTRSPEAEIDRLRRALDLAVTRIEILVGRARGCAEEHPGAHGVTAIEGPAWVEEGRAALSDAARRWYP
jgi:hypothetical protein